MSTEYRPTNDPDRFIKAETRESAISLRELQRQIAALNRTIRNMPEPKTTPDQMTLEFWNAMHISQVERETLIKQRAEKIALVEQLKAIRNG